MGLRINTNVAAITASRNLARNSEKMEHSLQALASGSRIEKPGDDAAGFAIAERLRGQERSLIQARKNADSAIGLIQVAEGGLSEQNNILVRLREIGVQAASDTVSDDEREFLDTEFQQLVSELDRIAKTTRFGQKQLLVGGSEEYEFFLGSSGKDSNDIIKYRLDTDTTADTLGVSGMSVTSKSDAQSVLRDLDESLMQLAKARAGFGAIQGRLQIAGNNLDVQRENIADAHSRIADTDVAAEVTELAKRRVLQDFGVAVLAQANQSADRVLRLI